MGKRRVALVGLLGMTLAVGCRTSSEAQSGGETPAAVESKAATQANFVPTVPKGFAVSQWAEVPNARSLALSPDGRTLIVGTRAGEVYKVSVDENQKASKVEVFQKGLNGSNGVAFLKGDLYLATLLQVLKFPASSGLTLLAKGEVIVDKLPDETHHGWRYLKAGPDGRLRISIGAPCNTCLRTDDERFASLCSFNPDGSDFKVEAHGIRNTVGFDWQPGTGDLYFSDNGRDMLGDDIPPCELNLLPKGQTGWHFGFPYYWGDNQRDDDITAQPPKGEYHKPAVKFQAHTAPLGCYFPRHPRWKGLLDGKLLVAQHGSWNRSTPVGYQVVSVDLSTPGELVEPFLDGFLRHEGNSYSVMGRPVDITELSDGTLLVSDDDKGKIWAVVPRI